MGLTEIIESGRSQINEWAERALGKWATTEVSVSPARYVNYAVLLACLAAAAGGCATEKYTIAEDESAVGISGKADNTPKINADARYIAQWLMKNARTKSADKKKWENSFDPGIKIGTVDFYSLELTRNSLTYKVTFEDSGLKLSKSGLADFEDNELRYFPNGIIDEEDVLHLVVHPADRDASKSPSSMAFRVYDREGEEHQLTGKLVVKFSDYGLNGLQDFKGEGWEGTLLKLRGDDSLHLIWSYDSDRALFFLNQAYDTCLRQLRGLLDGTDQRLIPLQKYKL